MKIFHFFQRIASGHLGVDGLLVLSTVGTELVKEKGPLSNMKNMVVENVLEVNRKKDHASFVNVIIFTDA